MPYPEGKKWRATKMIDGRRRSKLFATKAEAKRWEVEQNDAAWRESSNQTPTALSWATAYLDDAKARFSRKTYQEKHLAFRNLLAFVDPATPVTDITPADILAALRHRATGSGNAANKDRKNLVAAWAWGVQFLGLDERNPFKAVKRFAHDERPRHVPTEDEFWRACAAASCEEDRVFLLACLHTAARRGELFRLRWPDVDFSAGTIRLGTRKTADGGMQYALVPMTSRLRDALAGLRKRSMFVFCQEDGEPFTARVHLMKNICRRAGVRYFGFHAIQHLSASILAREGVDLPTVQAILRHQSATTTARYLRKLVGIGNVIEDVFCGKKEAPEVAAPEASDR